MAAQAQQAQGAPEAGQRVEELIARLRTEAGPQVAAVAEELVTCLVGLYGDGLAAIMRTIGDDSRLTARLIADPLVESLLLVHDLHPLDLPTRVSRALGRLGIGAELLAVDDDGVAHVRLAHGPASMSTEIEQAVTAAAPEISGVRLAPRELPLLQITRRPAVTS